MLVTVNILLLLSELYSNEYAGTAIWVHVSFIGLAVHDFQSLLNVGHLHVHCRFSMEPQATYIFILAEMPEAGDCNIYIAREH